MTGKGERSGAAGLTLSQSFSRPFAVTPSDQATRRQKMSAIEIELTASAEERAVIARELALIELETLTLNGRLSPWRRDGWRFDGRLQARAIQRCVVTLAPAPTKIDDPIVRLWTRQESLDDALSEIGAAPEPIDVDIDQETPEPLSSPIDLGVVAVEALSLALDPYPRADGATLNTTVAGPPDAPPMTDDAVKPFAGLSALRDKLMSAPNQKPDDQED